MPNDSVQLRAYEPADESAVIELWARCDLIRSWNDPRKDIARKLMVRGDLFLVATLDGRIVGTVMAGYEGHRGWINYLAVSPEHRRHGIGRLLMETAERLLRASGCPKINLQVRAGNSAVLEFYRAIGFAIDEAISMGKRLEQD